MNNKIYIETYGCQMNLADTEIISSILESNGFELLTSATDADFIFFNTCSVRENAENKIFEKIKHITAKKKKSNVKLGILGCMAERLKASLLDDGVDLVVGPDEYRRLPEIIEEVNSGNQGIAVRLSRVETYEDIEPLRKQGNSAWIAIMRGCDNMCSYCIVPYTRGRERSRPKDSIVKQVESLAKDGFKEITMLGQNVNSYQNENTDFAGLLNICSQIAPEIRFRFMTSHPKDLNKNLIEIISKRDNICKHLHLPIQSGSDRILDLMNRNYSSKYYLDLIKNLREIIPDISLTTDIIAGFPSETDDDHRMTMNLLVEIQYDGAYMFRYSTRENTRADKFKDDVPEEIKLKRLNEIISLQNDISKNKNQSEINRVHEVLIESPSRRNEQHWMGRSDTNKIVVFPANNTSYKIGDIVPIKIEKATSATLFGNIL